MSLLKQKIIHNNTKMHQSITEIVVKAAYHINIETIEKTTLTKAINLVRDGLGVLISGISHDTVKILAEHFKPQEPKTGIKVIGHNLNANLPEAAFMYGCAIHSMDFEPMFLPPTHAISPVLSPLIAIAQSREIDGKTFLKAFMAGIQIEAGLRIGAKISDNEAADNKNHFPFEKQGFHPPGTVGPLGAALASSIALGLTEDECIMALGYAASRSSGISGNIGTMTKATHCGNAARSGLEAAMLAARGLTSSKEIIETGSGWAQVFGGYSFNHKALTEGMEEISCFASPGFAIKKWPAHTAMQIAINGALQLHKFDHRKGKIEIRVPIFKYCNRPHPNSPDETRFSFQYNVAISLIDGFVNANSFCNTKLNSEVVQDYLKRIELNMDSTIPRDFGKMKVIIKLGNGMEVLSNSWPGHWKTPMTEEELSLKFDSCCSEYLEKPQIKQCEKRIKNIPKSRNINDLIKTLESL